MARNADAEPLFRFAVMADTHVNPADGESNSPWLSNRLANARTRHVVERINADGPDLVIHVGDMVHPVPGVPTYADAAKRFWEVVDDLDAPLHVVPGNHDVGEKPVEWAAAEPVTDSYLALYERTFAASHYSFDHHGCHFVVINTMLINSDLRAEREQRAWLEHDLATHESARTFVLGHYPIYLARPDEPEYYDNLAEPGRSWLLDLLERHGVEAYFGGHVHNFFYNSYGGTDCYLLPSTSFVRHDYSELSRVEPGLEYGRDDGDKLGYMVVDIYPDDHVAHIVRSGGYVDVVGGAAPSLPYVHVRRAGSAPVGVDMRQPWAELVDVPYNGLLDEFARRVIRDDYPLLTLWEMGIGALRVPLHDLLDETMSQRMGALTEVGHTFTVFSYDLPTGEARRRLVDRAALVDRIEIILAPNLIQDRGDAAGQLRADTGRPVHLSPLATSAHSAHDDQATAKFTHFVRHGFDVEDGVTSVPEGFDGVVFRSPVGRSSWQEIRAAERIATSLGMAATLHVSLAGDDPAAQPSDDLGTANRVAETLLAAWCSPRTHVFLDTFADVDRGYFPRLGLADRRHNVRLAGTVYRNLHAALREIGRARWVGDAQELPGARICAIRGDADALLVLPHTSMEGEALGSLTGTAGGHVIDLATGAVHQETGLADMTFSTPALVNQVANGAA